MSDMKALAIDIESAPNTAHVWGLRMQNISLNQLLHTGRVLCFSAKWLGSKRKPEFYSEFHDGRETMLSRAHALLSEADAIVTYNGKSFDVPMLNWEFLQEGLLPPDPYAHIDLYQVVRSTFRASSRKMDHICGELGIGRKTRHEGHELWHKCMDGDEAAWGRMRRYNIQDVNMTIGLYERILPWIKTHPNHAMFTDETRPVCTNCGGHHLQRRGEQVTRTQIYTRYQCQDCGTWQRTRFAEGSTDKRRATLIQTT